MELCLVHEELDPVIRIRVHCARNRWVESPNKTGTPAPGIRYQIGRVPGEPEKLFPVPADRQIPLSEGLEP